MLWYLRSTIPPDRIANGLVCDALPGSTTQRYNLSMEQVGHFDRSQD